MKPKLITLCLLLFSAAVFAQDFEVPASFNPKGAESDFAKYEPDLFKALDWLIKTSPGQQTEKRQKVNGFVVGWISGSPDVSLEIRSETLTFMNDNPQYLPIFMAGWTKHSLENHSNDAVKGTVAGIESVLQFYQKYKIELGKSKGLDAYGKLQEKGKLEDDVRSKLKS